MNIQSILSLILIVASVSAVMVSTAGAARADDLKYQELVRVMPPQRKSYPILESLEKQLYPGQDFREEDPGRRLERLEIAMLGSRQSGTVAERLERLRAEVMNWQIAAAPASKPNRATQLRVEADDIPPAELYALKAQERNQAANERMRYSKFLMAERSKARQETNVMRLANPIVQRLGKRSIDGVFGAQQK